MQKAVHKGICANCGKEADFCIEENATLYREATCDHCGVSIRTSDIIEEIKAYLASNRKDIAILNLCGQGYVHEMLKDFPGYRCSEFFDGIPSGEIYRGILCVDLREIPFADETFDLIISEDVLEHVEDLHRALTEIHRVLRRGGAHIFTIPLHEATLTVSRKFNPNKVFHGDPLRPEGVLVHTDFGKDIGKVLNRFSMDLKVKKKHVFFTEDEISYIDDEYEHYLAHKANMLEVFRYNSVVFKAMKNQ